MSKEGQLGQDQSHASSKEHGDTHKESAGSTPRASLPQEQQGWHEKSHEELVELFKNYRQRLQWEEKDILSRAPNYKFSAEDMIRGELSLQTKTLNKEKKRFFQPILAAWGILTYDRAKFFKDLIPSSLSREYPGETTIKLDPFQTRIIDALTEAFDIPHERGQAEIEIPEKLRSTKKG